MRLSEKEYERLPPHLRSLFVKLPNPGSDEVLEAFAAFGVSKDGVAGKRSGTSTIAAAGLAGYEFRWGGYGGEGTAARFFYSAKASKADRAGSKHPTVKPVALMRWLCRLVTPPGGVILDPFAGSGTTGQAAAEEGFDAILIEREAEYVADIHARLSRDLFAGAA